jgi:hypothetical protein
LTRTQTHTHITHTTTNTQTHTHPHAQVARLGARFHPNETSFPLAHAALRLQQIAAGLWPEPGEAPADDASRPVRALLAAVSGGGGGGAGFGLGGGGGGAACDVVRGVYESLLSSRPPALAFAAGGAAAAAAGGGGGGEDGGGGGGAALRASLLAGLVALCDIALREDLEGAPSGQARVFRVEPPLRRDRARPALSCVTGGPALHRPRPAC